MNIHQRTLGAEHPLSLNTLHNLATLLTARGAVVDAEQLHREVLATKRRVLGATHPDTLKSINGLGDALCAQEQWDEAESMFQQLLETEPGVGRTQQAVYRRHYGACLSRMGRHAEAEPVLLQAFQELERRLNDDDIQVRRARDRLVDLYEAWGNPEEAAKYRAMAQEQRH